MEEVDFEKLNKLLLYAIVLDSLIIASYSS
jgi:hypothetical protein